MSMYKCDTCGFDSAFENDIYEHKENNKKCISYLLNKVSKLEIENKELEQDIKDFEGAFTPDTEVMVKEGHFKDGALDMELEHPIFAVFAKYLVQTFIDQGGKNYFEVQIHKRNTFDWYIVTVQKKGKLSPHQKGQMYKDALIKLQQLILEEGVDAKEMARMIPFKIADIEGEEVNEEKVDENG